MSGAVLVADPSALAAVGLTEALTGHGLAAQTPVTDRRSLEARLANGAPPALVALGSALVPPDDLAPLVEAVASTGATCLVMLARDDVEPLPLLEAGALGFVPCDVGDEQLCRTVEAALRGEACIPRGTLATILRSLVERRRADDAAHRRYATLTPRETEVLALLVEGATTEVIAARLVLSPNTIRTHLGNLMAKLGVRSQVDAVRLVHEHDLRPRRSA